MKTKSNHTTAQRNHAFVLFDRTISVADYDLNGPNLAILAGKLLVLVLQESACFLITHHTICSATCPRS